MTKKQDLMRKYHLTDAGLKQLGDNILQLIDRDEAEFRQWGFTAARRAEFIDKLQTFAEIHADERFEGRKIAATQAKDAKRAELETLMRALMLRAKNALGAESGTLKEFGDAYVSRMNDEDLVRAARTALQAASDYMAELSVEGFDGLQLQTIQQATTALDEAIDKQKWAVHQRDAATEQRVKAGNALYTLITKYADIGKEIWHATQESKYNDYVIYTSASNNSAPPPTNGGEDKKDLPPTNSQL